MFFPSKNLAGVGVIFYVLSALRAAVRGQRLVCRESDWPSRIWPSFLDFVALGTVADWLPDHTTASWWIRA